MSHNVNGVVLSVGDTKERDGKKIREVIIGRKIYDEFNSPKGEVVYPVQMQFADELKTGMKLKTECALSSVPDGNGGYGLELRCFKSELVP